MKRFLLATVGLVGLLGIAHAVVLQGTDDHAQAQVLKAGFFRMSAKDSITAFATGGQTSATPLADGFNRVTTVVTNGDSVLLPPCVTGVAGNTAGYGNTDGVVVIVLNSSGNTLAVFPQTGQSINGGTANASVNLTTTLPAWYVCSPNGSWYSVPKVPS